ncbi:MAG: rod shape-determining protein RodA [Bacteroidia bacterium]|nr:rod shape-determining protein RodA [Bacteroidia bacterium]
MRERKNLLQGTDWILVGMYLFLVMIGWLNIYAAVFDESSPGITNVSKEYGKQMIFIFTGLALALAIMIVEPDFFSRFAFFIFGVLLLFLISVYFLGTEIKGSRSWFRFGDFGFQPAEFAKFATALALAKYLSGMNIRMNDLRTKLISAAIILVPTAIILLQNETGTALVYMSFIFVLYREGLSGNFLLGGFLFALLAILSLLFSKFILFWIIFSICVVLYLILKKTKRNLILTCVALAACSTVIFGVDYGFSKLHDYQKKRINVFLGKERDSKSKKDEYYNVYQSLVAIGSGGFTGKGYLEGTQTKYNYVPEQSTDFIFCTVGEEWGFLGSLFLLSVYLALILRIILVAERQRSTFSRIYGYGVACIFFIHILVNVGMTVGLAPVIGIPLPFMSYGGSSLWGFTILLFIFIKLDSHRLEIFR